MLRSHAANQPDRCAVPIRSAFDSEGHSRSSFDAERAATPKFEVKRHGASGHSNDCMPVPPGSYSASHFAGAAFITALFCQVDDHLSDIPKHPGAHLWPSEVVTLGLLHARKGVGNRAFYRWLTRDYRPLFSRLPECTRLFRFLHSHRDWTRTFLG